MPLGFKGIPSICVVCWCLNLEVWVLGICRP